MAMLTNLGTSLMGGLVLVFVGAWLAGLMRPQG
jgi:hypothetical protein